MVEPGKPEDSPEQAAQRLRLAFDMFAVGEALKREQLRREFPDATDPEIEAHLVAWLQDRPGAEFGDACGRPVAWPRPPR